MNKIALALLIISTTSIANIKQVSFETSMGAYGSTTKELYVELLQELENKESSWFRFIKPCNALNAWLTCKQGYTIFLTAQPTETRIPKVIHQIWVGPHPLPKKYLQWQKTWQALGWTYKLWTDKEVEVFPLINKDLYYNEKNYVARADILRIEILYKEGGLYVDTDFECLRPEEFARLHKCYDFYCGISPLDGKALLINNAIIASIPGHPILENYIYSLKNVDATIQCSLKKPENLIHRGPAHFAQSVLAHANKKYKDALLPCSYFYPLGMYQIENELSHLLEGPNTLENIKTTVVKPETLAIHWWDGSWNVPEAFERVMPHTKSN